MRKIPFNFKIEELTPFSLFVLTSYRGDHAAFLKFSPKYSEAHLTNYSARMDVVDQILNPKGLTAQMKKATQTLYDRLDAAIVFVDALQRYVEMGESKIPVPVKDFGFSGVRKKGQSRDAEGVLGGLRNIKQLAEPHLTELAAQGYTTEKQTALTQLITDISTANGLQNDFLNQRIKLVQDNIDLFTEFWGMVNDVLKSGKTIYKENPAKVKEYTQAVILRRIRRDAEDKDKGGTGTKG